jgi:hypothetical protein
VTTEKAIRKTLDELDSIVEAMWKRQEAWEADHPNRYRPLVCDGIGLVGRCTDTSVWLAERLKGVVHGYHHEDNPTAVLGETEGGHDFLLIDDRWLVDWWAKDTYQERDLYDLKKLEDQAEVERLYGDPKNWKAMGPKEFAQYRKHAKALTEE